MSNIKLKDGDVFSFMICNSKWKATVVGDRVKLLTHSERDYKYVQWVVGVGHRMEESVKELEDLLNNPATAWRLLTPITNKYEKEITMEITQDIYFDVAKHAKAWGVKHEEASGIIQKELFKGGRKWKYGINRDTAQHTSENYLHIYAGDNDICYSCSRSDCKVEATLQAHTTYTLHIQQPEEELVELMGKKYSKADIEKALSLLQPKEEA